VDKIIEEIRERVSTGSRLTEDDALNLFNSNDILSLGAMANSVTEKRFGDKAFYIVNCHINPTNICVNRCALCAFSRSPGEDGAFALTLDDVLKRARMAVKLGANELHIVGGLHPGLPFGFYLDLVQELHKKFPSVVLKAFTAVEVEYFSRISKLSVEDVLKALSEAGVACLPGGGAEIFASHVRQQICPAKISGEKWLEVMEKAHSHGLKTNATMLYGHVESIADRVAHLSRLRALQDRTGGFLCFIPLAFHPGNTRLKNGHGTSGYDDLRTIAVSRLFLDNFPHIKAYWIMIGERTGQVALNFGADDIDGTILEEHIAHEAGAGSPQVLAEDDLINLIRSAGKVPVRRNTFYTAVKEK